MNEKNNLLGFGFQISATCLFLLMDVCVKVLVADYPLAEIMFYRSVMGLPFLFVYLKVTGHMDNLRITRPVMHLWRAVIGGTAMFAFFNAYKYLPLAEAAAILYIAPIFITILSIIFLGEKIYFHRTFALILGFVGTLVIVRPSMDFNWYYVYPMLGALCFAVVTIIAHKLTKIDHPTSITVSFSVFLTVITGGITLYNGFSPMLNSTVIIYAVVMGNAGTIAQILNMQAIKNCHANFYAVTKYIGLFGSAAVGVLIFSEPLTFNVGLGMVIIAVSGIYISWREHVKNKKERMRLRVRG